MHLDTHVLVWLHAGLLDRFSSLARERLEEEALVVSPMAVLELEYLYEVGRVTGPSADVMEHLSGSLELGVASDPFPEVARAAVRESWTRDPFDRLIVAQARLAAAPLLSKDGAILERYDRALWA